MKQSQVLLSHTTLLRQSTKRKASSRTNHIRLSNLCLTRRSYSRFIRILKDWLNAPLLQSIERAFQGVRSLSQACLVDKTMERIEWELLLIGNSFWTENIKKRLIPSCIKKTCSKWYRTLRSPRRWIETELSQKQSKSSKKVYRIRT